MTVGHTRGFLEETHCDEKQSPLMTSNFCWLIELAKGAMTTDTGKMVLIALMEWDVKFARADSQRIHYNPKLSERATSVHSGLASAVRRPGLLDMQVQSCGVRMRVFPVIHFFQWF